jgi:hypothetical protein
MTLTLSDVNHYFVTYRRLKHGIAGHWEKMAGSVRCYVGLNGVGR